MACKAKAEALGALDGIKKALEGPEPLEGLARRQLVTSVDYAIEQVGEILELKRARRSPLTGDAGAA